MIERGLEDSETNNCLQILIAREMICASCRQTCVSLLFTDQDGDDLAMADPGPILSHQLLTRFYGVVIIKH